VRGIAFVQPLCNFDSDFEIGIGAASALFVNDNLIVAWFERHMSASFVRRVMPYHKRNAARQDFTSTALITRFIADLWPWAIPNGALSSGLVLHRSKPRVKPAAVRRPRWSSKGSVRFHRLREDRGPFIVFYNNIVRVCACERYLLGYQRSACFSFRSSIPTGSTNLVPSTIGK
jgi:hypothetical protein